MRSLSGAPVASRATRSLPMNAFTLPRRILICTLLSLLPAAAIPARADDEARQTIKSTAGRFSVVMPGTPKEAKQTINGINNVALLLESKDGTTYGVSYFDLPANMVLTLDTSLKAFVAGMKGEIVSQKQITLDAQFPGREAVIRVPKGDFVRIRLFDVRGRHYQILCRGAKDSVSAAPANAFFDSFKRT